MEYTPCEDPECYSFWVDIEEDALDRACDRYEQSLFDYAEQNYHD